MRIIFTLLILAVPWSTCYANGTGNVQGVYWYKPHSEERKAAIAPLQ